MVEAFGGCLFLASALIGHRTLKSGSTALPSLPLFGWLRGSSLMKVAGGISPSGYATMSQEPVDQANREMSWLFGESRIKH